MGPSQPAERPDPSGGPQRDAACSPADDVQSARRFGRIRVSGAKANLGRVLDISAGGMRIASRSMTPPRRGATIPVQIDVGNEEWMSVICRVAWVRATGLLRREIGLEFVKIEDDVKRSLLAMAHTSGSAAAFRLIPQSEREQE
jgi:hypothetical protein